MTFDSYTLGEVCSFIDYRGKTPKKATTGIPLITAKIVKNGFISKPDEFIAEEDYDSWMHRGIPRKGSVIMTTEAPLGEVARIPSDDRLAFAQRIIVLEPRQEILDAGFLYYALRDSVLMGRIKSRATGTTVTGIKAAELKKVEIDCPPIETQKRVASLLSSLDQRIENNESINDNLEQQAAAMFHDLFVVHADPSWSEGTISDLGTVVGGSTPSKAKPEYYTDHGIAWITPKDLSVDKSKFVSHGADDITELGLRNSSASIMPRGTVLFSSRAPIGYIAIADGEVTTNQGFKSVIPHDNIGTAFVYYFLKAALPTIEGMASGSTFKEISGSAMRTVPAIIPDDDTLRRFKSFCDPLFQQQRTLEMQNRELAEIRDALLPRLMAGEIDVSSITL